MKSKFEQQMMEQLLRRPKPETLCFVYGTLLRDEGNHRFLADARFVGPARTLPCFRLVDLGAYPAMREGGSAVVVGELYGLDDEQLARVDRLEGHPRYYSRTRIRLASGTYANAYLLPPHVAPDAPEIESGDWRAHRRDRACVRGTSGRP